MLLCLIEPDKSLREALTLNLVTTGGFEVQHCNGDDKKTQKLQYAAFLINRSRLEQLQFKAPPDCPIIVYQTPSSYLTEHCPVKRITSDTYEMQFSISSLPGFANAIWQILNKRNGPF